MCSSTDECFFAEEVKVVSNPDLWTLQVEDVTAEALRLSRCLSQASFPPEPAAGETRLDKNNKKVTDPENPSFKQCSIKYYDVILE